jgi:ArsR family transcriptional regulator, arsenate/arsenite/antimonite-responsive transcriptional repressor
MKDLLAITGALADSNRLRALAACLCGELCVCQIIELLDLAPSTVSKHLSILKQAGLLESRKEGRWMYYRIPDEQSPAMVREALEFVRRSLGKDKQVAEDIRRLKQIVKMDPEELCQKQRADSECSSSAPATRAAVRWPKDGLVTSRAR